MESSNGKGANQIPFRSSWYYDSLSRCIWHNTQFEWLGGGWRVFFPWRLHCVLKMMKCLLIGQLSSISCFLPPWLVVRNFRPTTADRFRGAKSPVEQGEWVELVDLGHFGHFGLGSFSISSVAALQPLFGMWSICWTRCRIEAYAPILASPPNHRNQKYFTKIKGLLFASCHYLPFSIFFNISYDNFRMLLGDLSVCFLMYDVVCIWASVMVTCFQCCRFI